MGLKNIAYLVVFLHIVFLTLRVGIVIGMWDGVMEYLGQRIYLFRLHREWFV